MKAGVMPCLVPIDFTTYLGQYQQDKWEANSEEMGYT